MVFKKGEIETKAIAEMSVLEIVDLVEAMEEKFGPSATEALVAASLKSLNINNLRKSKQISRLISALKEVSDKKKKSVLEKANFELILAQSQGFDIDQVKMTRIFPVAVYLGGGERPDLIISALNDFGQSLGFDILDSEKPKISSFFQRLFSFTRSKKTKQEVSDAFLKGKNALEARHIKKPTSEADLNVANGAAALLNALGKDSKSSALFYGGLLILSIKDGSGESHNRIISLTDEQTQFIQENLNLLQNPEQLLNIVDEKIRLAGND